MKKIFIILMILPSLAYSQESFDITIHWTCEEAGCLVEQRDLAALYLNYQDEIEDSEGNLILNPVSKKQTIINKLVESLQNMVIAGAAKEADLSRITAVTGTTLEVSGINGE